jgi:hypothetical protein
MLQGNPIETDDPKLISSIVSELNDRESQFLQNHEYQKSHEIETVVVGLRQKYRDQDRYYMYDGNAFSLKRKYKETKGAFEETKELWENKLLSLKNELQVEKRVIKSKT